MKKHKYGVFNFSQSFLFLNFFLSCDGWLSNDLLCFAYVGASFAALAQYSYSKKHYHRSTVLQKNICSGLILPLHAISLSYIVA